MQRAGLRANAARSAALAAVLALGLSYAVYAAVSRVATPHRPPLTIGGRVDLPLYPGDTQPVDLQITNRYSFDVALLKLTVELSLDTRHRTAGCSATRDFRVVPMPGWTYPILMRAHSSATLAQLGVRRLPYLRMVDRDVDQASCRGTQLGMHYRVVVRRLNTRERALLRRGPAPR
jgi:hypothetical protein